jgi:hypothetical protein
VGIPDYVRRRALSGGPIEQQARYSQTDLPGPIRYFNNKVS